jgi:hypothetical protein
MSAHFGPFLRSFFHLTRPPETVPEYPLRCQHCCEPIKLGKRNPLCYRDAAGLYVCKADTYLPHRPMPSVLG